MGKESLGREIARLYVGLGIREVGVMVEGAGRIAVWIGAGGGGWRRRGGGGGQRLGGWMGTFFTRGSWRLHWLLFLECWVGRG